MKPNAGRNFSWEYPPRIVGQLADYLKDLAVQLVKNKVGVLVVTYHDYMTGLHDDPEGVKIYRVNNPVRTHIGVLTWVLTLNQEVERAASNIYYDVTKQIDVIDVHDWHFIPAAVTLKKRCTYRLFILWKAWKTTVPTVQTHPSTWLSEASSGWERMRQGNCLPSRIG